MLKLITATYGSLALSASDVADEHPNDMHFEGVLCQLDEASTKPPNGSRGHRILIPKDVAQRRMDTLLGMGVNLSTDKDGHAPQRKVGVIKKAWIKGKELWISGTVWKKDFPDAEEALKSKKLGMSFEGSDVAIEDANAHIWTVKDLVFTGAALLLKTAAAYSKTEALAASAMFAELVGIHKRGAVMPKTIMVKESTAFDSKAFGEALTKAIGPLAAAVASQTAAITSLHASMENSQADVYDLLAKGKKPSSSSSSSSLEDDEDGDEEEAGACKAAKAASSSSSSEEGCKAAKASSSSSSEEGGVKAAKGKKASSSSSSSSSEEALEGKRVKAKSDNATNADDAGKLENLEDEDIEDGETSGHMSEDADKSKGSKTSVTASTRLRKLANKLMAENETLRADLKASKKKTKKIMAQVEVAAARVSRKSVSSVALTASTNASKPSTLFTGLVGKYDLEAEGTGSKKTMAEFNEILNAAGITDPTQRIALKSEAERNGTVYITGEDQK